MDTYDVLVKGGGKVVFNGIVKCEKKYMTNLFDILFETSYSCIVYRVDSDED